MKRQLNSSEIGAQKLQAELNKTKIEKRKSDENAKNFEKLYKDEMNRVDLFRIYRDWIQEFINKVIVPSYCNYEELERIFLLVREHNVEHNERNEYDKVLINKFNNFLTKMEMSLEEFSLLINFKDESNIKFHSDKQQSIEAAIVGLNRAFPTDLGMYRRPLMKALMLIKKG